jgi:hypothetical protein
MKPLHGAAHGCALLICSAVGWAQSPVAQWTFGTSTSPSLLPSTVANVSAGSFGGLTGSPTTGASSPMSGGAGGSGGSYFTAQSWRSSDGNYFCFTVTPASGYTVTLSSLSFNYAATGTGPTSYTLLSSSNSYSTPLTGSSLTPQAGGSLVSSDWHSVNSSITLSFATPTTFRLTATGASGASGSFRVDDVSLNGNASLTAVPEPATYAVILGAIVLAHTSWQRRRRNRHCLADDRSASAHRPIKENARRSGRHRIRTINRRLLGRQLDFHLRRRVVFFRRRDCGRSSWSCRRSGHRCPQHHRHPRPRAGGIRIDLHHLL